MLSLIWRMQVKFARIIFVRKNSIFENLNKYTFVSHSFFLQFFASKSFFFAYFVFLSVNYLSDLFTVNVIKVRQLLGLICKLFTWIIVINMPTITQQRHDESMFFCDLQQLLSSLHCFSITDTLLYDIFIYS